MFSRLQVLDEGRLERRTFCPKNRENNKHWCKADTEKIESLGTSLSNASKIDHDIGHLGFMCSSFVTMLLLLLFFFYYRLLLSRRWKRVEIFMTVVMYPPKKHGLSARSKNWYNNATKWDRVYNLTYGQILLARDFGGFHSLSLLVESKVSLSCCYVLVSLFR